jgi:hypothetical protein
MSDRRPALRNAQALWAFCALALAILCVWALGLRGGRVPPVFPEGDPAVIELYTWQASHGLWAYGPYSRFGWHHPGPLYFYLLAPFYAVSGSHTLALDAGAFALNLIAVTLAAWTLIRQTRGTMALPVLIALMGYLYEVSRLLTSVWNPHVLLVPFVALIITAAMVMAGRLSLLPVTLAIASFVAQTHVGLLPVAVVICLCAVAGALRHPQPALRPWLAGSAALLVLLWWPSLLEQFTSPTGNLAAIARFFGPSGPAGAGVSFTDALAVWGDTLTQALRLNVAVPYGNIITITHTAILPLLATLEVLLLGFAAWHLHRRERASEAALALLCAIASVAALWSIAGIRGGLLDHLVGWVAALGALNAGVLVGAALTWLDERRPLRLASLTLLASAVGIMLVIVLGGYGGERLRWQSQEVIRKSTGGRTPTQALYQELQSTMTRTSIHKPLIHAAVLSWPQAAGIALQLTKTHAPFASDLVWLFGPQATPHGDEDADITVADTPTRHALSQRPGDCMLMERHGTSLHLLAMPPERFAALVCVAP